MARKRKSKGTQSQSLSSLPPDPSQLSHNELIAHYHTLQKQLANIDKAPFPNAATREARRQLLLAQLRLISLDQYQTASRSGEKLNGNFDSSQWVLSELRQQTTEHGLKILDVGAIRHRFPDKLDDIALDVTSIDLNPAPGDRRVVRADFFEFARGKDGVYDVVCLCLCVNFVGCAFRRGVMMALAADLLEMGGLVFVSLPRACLMNSRYCDESVWEEVLSGVGLTVVKQKVTDKLFMCVAKKERGGGGNVEKRVVRGGDDRNNFAVWLDWAAVEKVRKGEVDKTGDGGKEGNEVDGGKMEGDEDGEGDGGAEGEVDMEADVDWRRKKKKRKRKGGVQKVQLTSNQRKRARRRAMRAEKNPNVE